MTTKVLLYHKFVGEILIPKKMIIIAAIWQIISRKEAIYSTIVDYNNSVKSSYTVQTR